MSIGPEGLRPELSPRVLSTVDNAASVWVPDESFDRETQDPFSKPLRSLGLGVLALMRENGQIPPDQVFATAEVLLANAGSY